MKTKPFVTRELVPFLASLLLLAGSAGAAEIKVMTSGGFTAAYNELTPPYEKLTGDKVVTAYGASMGNAPDAIPSRLARGEPVDIVILAAPALDELIKQGKVIPGSRVDLVRTRRRQVVGRIAEPASEGHARPAASATDPQPAEVRAARLQGAQDDAVRAGAAGDIGAVLVG